MVHRAGMVDSMAIVGNIRPAAPPGVWQPSAAPLASAGAPSVVYDADTTDEFDYISRRGKDGLRTITTTSGGQTTTFTAGPGLEQKRGRGWVGTDVMPSPADVEQGLLYRALHPPLPTTSPSTSPAPPNHHPTSFSNDIESIGNDHSTASRPASSASSAAGGGGGFAYGARPMKWAASTNAPLELHDKMTGLRLNRNLPPPLVKHVPLIPPALSSSLTSPMPPRGPDDAPLPIVDEPVVLRPLRATGKPGGPPEVMPFGPVTAKEKYQQAKEQADVIRETPKWAFIDQLHREYRHGMSGLEQDAAAPAADGVVAHVQGDNRMVALSTHTLETLAGQVHPDLAGMLRKIGRGYEEYLCDGGTIRNTEMRIARNKVIDNQRIVSGDKVDKAKERCAYLRDEIIKVATENERLEAELAVLSASAADPEPSKQLERADEGEFAQRERQAQLVESSFDRKVRLAQENITDVEDDIEALTKLRASTCVPSATADWYRGMVAEASAQLERITKENELMGYDIDELDYKFQEAVQASKDLQIQLPGTAEELAAIIKEVDKAKRGLLFGPGALEAPARRRLAALERRSGSAPAGLYNL